MYCQKLVTSVTKQLLIESFPCIEINACINDMWQHCFKEKNEPQF